MSCFTLNRIVIEIKRFFDKLFLFLNLKTRALGVTIYHTTSRRRRRPFECRMGRLSGPFWRPRLLNGKYRNNEGSRYQERMKKPSSFNGPRRRPFPCSNTRAPPWTSSEGTDVFSTKNYRSFVHHSDGPGGTIRLLKIDLNSASS